MIMPAAIGIFLTPFYLLTGCCTVITADFIMQGAFLGAIDGQNQSHLAERFPTAVRPTAAGFCYHQGAIWGCLVAPVMAAFATGRPSDSRCPCWQADVAAARYACPRSSRHSESFSCTGRSEKLNSTASLLA
jgi:hypothetical protein